MNSNDSIIVNSETDTLKSISISDVEAQIIENNVNENRDTLSVPLKSILRREVPSSVETEEAGIMVLKICSIIFILIIMVPIIIADLYFGFTDTSCVKDKPDGLDISMKLYLLVSGFVGMGAILIYIASICLLSPKNDEKNVASICCIYFAGFTTAIFHLIWNILGAIVFWGTIYGEKICNKNVSTYIFVSLIIKLIGNLASFLNNNSEKKK
jgi:hypothetical protein